jgi:hypothetical protein
MTMTLRRGTFLASVALACLAALPSAAQAQSAIAGVVKDSSGAVLPGVTVEAASDALIEKTRTVTTDGSGLYKIIDLRPGVYTITVTLAGFQTFKREQLELPSGFTATVDATMKVGGLEESVTVSGSSPVVDVQSNTQARVLPREILDSVPNAHTIQSVGQLIPGLSLTSPDVGGSVQMQQTYFSVHGIGAAGTSALMDGMIVNTMEADGAVLNYFTTAGNQEMVYQTGGGGGDAPTGGLNLNMVPREGGNRFSGSSSLGLENWQSDNFTQQLKDRGVTAVDKLGSYHDFDVTQGGPIKRDRIWFFLVGRIQGEQKPVANTTRTDPSLIGNPTAMAAAVAACRAVPGSCPQGVSPEHINSGLGRLTMQVSQKIKLQLYDDRVHKDRASAIASGDDQSQQGIHWTSPNYTTDAAKLTATVTSRLLIEGGWSSAIERYDTYYQDGLEQRPYTPLWYTMAARNNTTDTLFSVAPVGEGRDYPDRYNWQGSASYVTGSHNIKVGFHDSWGVYWHGNYRNADLVQQYQNVAGASNVPYQVTLYPTDPRYANRLNALIDTYAQDSWTFKRMTLMGGLRWDYVHESAVGQPAQQGTFEVIPAFSDFQMPIQKNWSPRVSSVVDLFGNGKTAVRAGFNRFAASATDSLADGQNPGKGQTTSNSVPWRDLNGDNVVQYTVTALPNGGVVGCVYLTPGCEIDFSKLPSNFGAGGITNQLDPNLRRPYYIQTNLGISHEVMRGVSVSVDWYRTDNKDIQSTKNLTRALPAGITDPTKNPNYRAVTLFSPIDGHAVTMYDVASQAVLNAAPANFTFTDPNQSSTYNGVDVSFNARLAHGVRVFGGGTRERRVANLCASAVDNPNNLLYCDQSQSGIPWKTQVKLSLSSPLPWYGLNVSASYQGLPGYTLARTTYTVNGATRYVTCPGNSAAQGCVVGALVSPNQLSTNFTSYDGTTTTVTGVQLTAPATTLTPRTNQVDFGLSKRVTFGRLRVDPRVDLFNLLNSNDYYSVRSTSFSPILDSSSPDPTHSPALPALAAGTSYTNYLAPARFLQGRILKIGFNVTW